MKRRTFLHFTLGAGALAASARAAVPGAAALHWSQRTLNAMGTTMSLQVAHADAAQAEHALDAAVAEIRHIEDLMSLFRPDSAICTLNREGFLAHPHPDLLEVLRIAQQVSQHSGGAFDVTVQPLWQAYASAQAQGRLPRPAEVDAARRRVGWRGLLLQEDSVRLASSGMAITLNGIAQGFAADKVRARLQGMGVQHALVDAGEWAALGHSPRGSDWTLGVANPRDAHALLAGVALPGGSLATSADDQCSFSPDHVHHHIFDPRTGESPRALASVSVLAPRCVMADALTKVLFMGGMEQALALARHWQVEVLVVDKQGHWRASPGLALRPV